MSGNEKLSREIDLLKQKIAVGVLPSQLRLQLESAIERLTRMANLGSFSSEYDNLVRYIDWVTNLPWDKKSSDNLDLKSARAVLERNHYGLNKIKERLLEFLAVLNLTAGKKTSEGTVLCFVGLPGIGKTSIVTSIAEALGRQFVRIPFGGIGDVNQLRGLPRYLPSAEPGQILKSLRRCGSKNPVVLFDEIDRVADPARAAIMGVLLEVLDPEQNDQFLDYYLDFPFDLSEVLFVCTANNTHGIANAVLDRLEVIEMPAYTDEEKRIIGRDYLLPKALERTGLTPLQLQIAEDLWSKIIRPLGYDSGIRTLERTVEGICRKVALKIVEGGARKFELNEVNIKEFLPTW